MSDLTARSAQALGELTDEEREILGGAAPQPGLSAEELAILREGGEPRGSDVETIAGHTLEEPPPFARHQPDGVEQLQVARNVLDAPAPKNYAELIRQGASKGVFFNPQIAGAAPDLRRLGQLYSANVFQELGLWSPVTGNVKEADDRLFQDVSNAIFFNLARQFDDLTDEERPTVQRRAMVLTMRKAEETALQRLARLEADGKTFDDPEVKHWRDIAANARMLSNRVDDPEYLGSFMDSAKMALHRGREFNAARDLEGRLELGISTRLFDVASFERERRVTGAMLRGQFPVDGFGESSAAHKKRALVQQIFSEALVEQGDDIQISNFLDDALRGAVSSVRNEAMGIVDPAQAAELGAVRLLRVTHPLLFSRLIDAKQRNQVRLAMGDQVVGSPARFHQEFKKRYDESLAGALDAFWGAAAFGSPAHQARRTVFNPVSDSGVSDEVDEAYQHLGVMLRNSLDTANAVSRALTRSAAGAIVGVSPEQILGGDIDRDVSPHAVSLSEDALDGKLSWGTVQSIVNPEGSPLLAAAILNSPAQADTAQRSLLDAGRKGVDPLVAREFWLRARAQALAEMEVAAPDAPFVVEPATTIEPTRPGIVAGFGVPFISRPKSSVLRSRGSELAGTAEAIKDALAEYSVAFGKLEAFSPSTWIQAGTKMMGWAAQEAVGTVRQTYQLLRENPDDVVSTIAVSYALGPLAGLAARRVSTAAKTLSANVQGILKTRLLRNRLRDAVATDKVSAERVLAEMKKMRIENPGDLDRVIDSATSSLEGIIKAHKDDVNMPFQGTSQHTMRHMTQSVQRFRKTLNKVDEGTTARLLERGSAEQDTLRRDLLQEHLAVLPELARAVKDKLGFWGTTIPNWVAKNSPKAFSALKEAFDAGGLEQLSAAKTTSAFSIRSAHKIRGRGMRLIKERLPAAHREALDLDAKIEGTAPYIKDVVDTFTRTKPFLEGFRLVAGEKRVAGKSFFEHVGRMRRAQGRDATAAAADRAARQLDDFGVDRGLRFEDHPATQGLTIEEMASWAATQETPGRNLWSRMSLAKETPSDFYARITNLDEAGLEAFRKKFLREYVNTQDIRRSFAFDSWDTRRPISADMARRLRAQRGAVRNAFVRRQQLERQLQDAQAAGQATGRIENQIAKLDARVKKIDELAEKGFLNEEFLAAVRADPEATTLGIGRHNLGPEWQKIEAYAAAEKTDELLGVFARAQDIADPDLNTSFQAMRSAHLENKLNIQGFLQVQERLAEALRTAPKEVQDAFSAALRAQDEAGDYLPMAEFRKQHPEIFKKLPEGGEKNIERLLTADKDMRRSLGEILASAGYISEAELEVFAGPYLPRQYRAFTDRRIMATNLSDAEAPTGRSGYLGDELEARRDLQEFRLLVRPRDGAPEEMTFPTLDEATDFVRQKFGIRKGRKGEQLRRVGERKQDATGTTATGETFDVLAPVGLDKANALKILPEGASLLDRWFSLSKLAGVARTAKMMDRPGLSFTPAEWKVFSQSPRGRQIAGDFEQLPQFRKYGPLQGKYVHKGVKQHLLDAEDSIDILHEVRELSAESLATRDRLFRAATRGIDRAFLGLPSFFKNTIVANGIFRNPRVHIQNILTDFGVFARGATDSGWWFSRSAGEARRAGWGAIFGSPEKLQKLIDTNPFVRDALNLGGVLDDSLAGPLLTGKGRRAVRELIFDTDPVGDNYLKFVFNLRGEGKGLIRGLFGDNDSPLVKQLRARVDEIEGFQKDATFWDSLGERAQTALIREQTEKQAVLRRQTGKLSAVHKLADFASFVMQGKHVGKKGLGTFGDVNSLSAEFYQRFSNWNRMSAYLYNRQRGLDHDAALRRVNTFMQNYSNVPNALREFSRGPLASPILSFPYELTRIGFNLATQQPGLFAGMVSVLPIMNMFTMGAAGIDPETVMGNLGREAGGMPAWSIFNAGLVAPRDDGSFGFAQLPGIDALQLGRDVPGIFGRPFGNTEDQSALERGLATAGNLVARHLFNNPALNAGVATLMGRDMRSGQPFRGRLEASMENGKNLLRTLVPPLTPVVGSAFRDVTETATKPGNLRTGRVESVAERSLQSFLGVRLRGFGDLRQLDSVARGILALGGDTRAFERSLRGTGGFTDEDLVANLIVAARASGVDPSAQAAKVEVFIDNDLREARGAIDMIDAGDEEAGRERLREAAEAIRLKKRWETWAGDEKAVSEVDESEIQKTIRGMLKQRRADQVFQRKSLSQKAWIITRAARMAQSPETVKRLVDVTLGVTTGEKFEHSTLGQQRRAIDVLDNYLRDVPQGTGVGHGEVRILRDYLQAFLPQAEREAALQQERDATGRAAAALLQE